MRHPRDVLPFRDLPFPAAAVRDLRGVLRAMYREQREQGAAPETLARIETVGRELKKALELHREFGDRPRTMGHRAAWKAAEEGAHAAGQLVDELYPIAPIIRATATRIARGGK